MTGKSTLERLERMEASYVFSQEAFEEIRDHLATLNGAVAKNTEFRIQAKMILVGLAFAWISIIVPLLGIAVTLVK